MRRWARGLGLALGGAVLVELLSAIWWPAPPVDRAPLVKVTPDPGLGYRLAPQQATFTYQAEVRTDARGLRVGARTGTSERRLLFVGGSETFGKGVRFEQTFAARTAAGLGPAWRAVNAGTPDWNLEQSVRFVLSEGAGLAPAAVVLTMYWDDLYADRSAPTTEGANARSEWFARRWARESGVLEWIAPLYTRSRVLCALRNEIKPEDPWRRALRAGEPAPGLEAAWAAAQTNLSRLRDWADARRVDVFVLVLPIEPAGQGAFAPRATAIAEQSGLPVVDASEALVKGGAASFIAYDGRPSAEGHARIAAALIDVLEARYRKAR